MDIGKEDEKVTVEPIVNPVKEPKEKPVPVPEREPVLVPAIREELAAAVASLLSEGTDQEAVVFLTAGIAERDWRVVIAEAKGRDVPKLRRIRKLANHRRWRQRNVLEERERAREYHKKTKVTA